MRSEGARSCKDLGKTLDFTLSGGGNSCIVKEFDLTYS